MSENSPPDRESSQSGGPPEDPENDAQDKTPDPLPDTNRLSVQDLIPIIHSRRASIQEPPPSVRTRRVSIQEPLPTVHSRRVSIQEPPPSVHTRRVSIQEPPPSVHTRRVSIQEHPLVFQETLPVIHARRVSIQEPSPILHRRVSIQEPPPSVYTRRVSIQEPPPSVHTRRVSVQEPPPILHRRVSVQEPPPILRIRGSSVQDPSPVDNSLWGSIREAPSTGHISPKGIQETPSVSSIRQAAPQDAPSVTHDSHLNAQNVPLCFQLRSLSIPRTSLKPHIPLACIESVAYSSQSTLGENQSQPLSSQGIKFPNRASVEVPPSITDSPEASLESMESILWVSQEDFKESLYSLQLSKNTPDSNTYSFPAYSSTEASSVRFVDRAKRRYSQLPIGTRLLHEAKKISRLLSLLLSLGGVVIIGLITLSLPWVHFQVPLAPPRGPADPLPLTIPINTVFFKRCVDVSCLHEQDHNAYLLDSSWAFFLISGFTSFCLCLILIDIVFFTNSNVPLLDFSNIILSNLTGTAMVFGILFYLLQASEFLQEGMTYRLGCSFYLAWTGIFFFLAIGFISYMNYINFWFILAPHAEWT